MNTQTSRACVTGLLAAAGLLSLASFPGCSSSQPTPSAPSAGAVSSRDTVTFRVEGMACPNCAKHVAEALQEVPGVKSASVNFDTKIATVALDPSKPATIKALQASVAAWHTEHFSQEEDPECLDPVRRKELQKQGG